jgi:hypothetical protein
MPRSAHGTASYDNAVTRYVGFPVDDSLSRGDVYSHSPVQGVALDESPDAFALALADRRLLQ